MATEWKKLKEAQFGSAISKPPKGSDSTAQIGDKMGVGPRRADEILNGWLRKSWVEKFNVKFGSHRKAFWRLTPKGKKALNT